MEKPVIERVELALSTLQNLMPDFKQLEKNIGEQMVALQHTKTNHVFLHFDRQIAVIENSCSNAVTQLEYLLSLNRTLCQLMNLQAHMK